jgi:AcrR family transcriptional regulator
MPIKTDTKQKIILAAIELFSQNGYHETSVRDIAKLVGIKDCSLYSHFTSKEQILGAILDYYQNEMDKMWQAEQTTSSTDPEALLAQTIQRFKTLNAPTPMDKIGRLLLLEMYRNEKVSQFYYRWKFNEYRSAVQKVFEELQQAGKLKPLDPEFLASLYQALANYFYHEYYLLKTNHQDLADFETRIQSQFQMFLELIRV